jgi:predicted DCC family thiol-disulfide oxidoreductase YuxK
MADTIFYDGHCGFCHRLVRFVLAVDRRGAFRFAPLGGVTFENAVPPATRASLPDSIVVRTADGELLVHWASSLHILQRLGGIWRLMGSTLDLLPRGLLDWCYDQLAGVRKRLFREPEEMCPRVPPHLRSMFDL